MPGHLCPPRLLPTLPGARHSPVFHYSSLALSSPQDLPCTEFCHEAGGNCSPDPTRGSYVCTSLVTCGFEPLKGELRRVPEQSSRSTVVAGELRPKATRPPLGRSCGCGCSLLLPGFLDWRGPAPRLVPSESRWVSQDGNGATARVHPSSSHGARCSAADSASNAHATLESSPSLLPCSASRGLCASAPSRRA